PASPPRDGTGNFALLLKETAASFAQGESVTILRICVSDHRVGSLASQKSAASTLAAAAKIKATSRREGMSFPPIPCRNEYTRTEDMIHGIKVLPWLLVSALLLSAQRGGIESLAPFTPTPEAIVDRMLQLGELRPGEKMFDLGSGDGRIVILAARKYKADATGVEFEETLVKQSMKRI